MFPADSVVGPAPSALPAVMQAAQLVATSGLDAVRLAHVPVPEPGPDELLIAVRTVGANQLDLNTMRGLGPGAATPLPLTLGIDPAGTVLAQGAEVDGDRRGERVVVKPNIACGRCVRCREQREADCPAQAVVGVHRPGGAAQYVTVPARNAFGIGELDFALATAAVHSVPIALHAINAAGGIAAGSTVLVTGATGAVGSAAVQLARHLGADVVAASTSRTVTRTGVTGVRYAAPDDLVQAVRGLAPEGVDLAVDGTGHGDVMGAALRCLGWTGRLAVCSASLATDLRVDARALYQQRLSIIGAAAADYAEVREALRLVAAGDVTPAIGARFPLAEIHRAYEAVSDRTRNGKVVIDVS